MAYSLLASPAGQRSLDDLPKDIGDGFRKMLQALAEAPRSKRFDLKPLQGPQGKPPLLRLRVGDYRAILFIDHARREVVVVCVGRRATAYRGVSALGD